MKTGTFNNMVKRIEQANYNKNIFIDLSYDMSFYMGLTERQSNVMFDMMKEHEIFPIVTINNVEWIQFPNGLKLKRQ